MYQVVGKGGTILFHLPVDYKAIVSVINPYLSNIANCVVLLQTIVCSSLSDHVKVMFGT